MIQFILKYLNKIKQFFVIIPVLIAIMVFVGLFFANKKSEPEFATKAERIMFEIKDKSPKYVITLPSQKEEKNNEEAGVAEEKVQEVAEVNSDVEEQSKIRTNNEKLSELDIPLLSRLPDSHDVDVLENVEPIEDLLETNDKGQVLPISNGLLKPWEVYGRKVFVMPMFNKVVVVFKNLGTNRYNTDLIIQHVPANVSLSFSPYATETVDAIKKARTFGHETYLDMLLPSRDFAKTDSGPQALNFNKSVSDNIDLLEEQLSQEIVVGGFVVNDGIDDDVYDPYFQSIMEMIKKRGLLLFDATHGKNIDKNNVSGLDRVKADFVIDHDFSRASIRRKLEQAEQYALKTGNVVIVSDSKPVAVLEIVNWLQTFSKQLSYEEMKEKQVTSFKKPLILVPLSNLVGEY